MLQGGEGGWIERATRMRRRLDTTCYKEENEAGYNVLQGGERGWIQRATRMRRRLDTT